MVKRNSVDTDSFVTAAVAQIQRVDLARRRAAAASLIQRAWRARKDAKHKNRAAVKIQRAYRAAVLVKRRRQLELEGAVQTQQQSALIFSSFYRFAVKMVQAGVDEIQRIGNDYLARQRLRSAAAAVIQRAWRRSQIQKTSAGRRRQLELENAVQIQQLIGLNASTLAA